MSDLPYVFHCTPCGKPHAGECPPKSDGLFAEDALARRLDEAVAATNLLIGPSGGYSIGGQVGRPATAVKNGLPNFPGVGDFYTYEVWNSKLGGWQHSQAVYEITGWSQHKSVSGQTANTVHYKVPGGKLVFDIEFQVFDMAGMTLPTGDLTRFVGPIPASPPPAAGITYPAAALPGLGSVWKCQLFLTGSWTGLDHRRYVVTSVDPNETTVAEQNSGSPTGSQGRWKYPNAAWTPAGAAVPRGHTLRFVVP